MTNTFTEIVGILDAFFVVVMCGCGGQGDFAAGICEVRIPAFITFCRLIIQPQGGFVPETCGLR